MDVQNPSAPPRAQSAPADNPTRTRRLGGGITHDNTRHTTRFVVIGNHLVQHEELSLLAIGLSCHLQSLPTGAGADIKSLAARFPEGPTRIAAALRELEAHGYLRRERHRTQTGRNITRTVSCNQPHASRREPADTGCPPAKRTPPPPRRAGPKALPAVPRPSSTAPALLQTALDLLADLRRRDARLLLSATDTAHLVPGVAAWLERDVAPGAVRDALTTGLPDEPLRRPAALLAHRLADRLPPPPPFRTPSAAVPPPRHPLQNCEGCDRGFRAPAPESRCRDCRTTTGDAPPGTPPGHVPSPAR